MNKDKTSYQSEMQVPVEVVRYNEMLGRGKRYFFDVHEFEIIVDYFLIQNEFEKAQQAINTGLCQHPGSFGLKIKYAQYLTEKGQFDEALQEINQLEYVAKLNPDVFFLKGVVYCFNNNIRESVKYFNKAAEFADDDKVDILFNAALNLEQVNEFALSVDFLEKARHFDPQNLVVIFELGYCCERLEMFNESERLYNEYLDIDPFSDTAWFNLGGVYATKELYDKAIEAYDFALALNDKHPLASFNRGNAFANSGLHAKAIRSYQEYLDIEPGQPEALCYIGECYEHLNKLDKAIDYYYQALSVDPNFADAVYGIAIIHSLNERKNESLNFLLKAIQLDDKNPEYWYSLGNIYTRLALPSKAIDAFNQAIVLDPCDYESWLNLSELYLKQNLLTKAIKTLEESYEHNSEVALINYRLAAYNLLRCNINEGVRYLKKAINKNFKEHEEIFKFCPGAAEMKEIKELLGVYNQNKKHERKS
jgi:tetratricopeptide (TPR) repeat protein